MTFPMSFEGSRNVDTMLAAGKPTAAIPDAWEEVDDCEYTALIGQQRQFAHGLAIFERRGAREKYAPVGLERIVKDGAGKALRTPDADKLVLQLPESVFVEGPADDLIELIACLVEYGHSGPKPIRLSAQINYTGDEQRPTCTTELLLPSGEVPEFLRRKVFDTVRARQGEVTIAGTASGHRISFTLPVERRLGTILG